MFGSTVLVPVLSGSKPSHCTYFKWDCNNCFSYYYKMASTSLSWFFLCFYCTDYCCKATGGPGGAMIGCFMVGLVYGIVALIIKKAGYHWIMKLLPPIVVGPVIMVIGLALSSKLLGYGNEQTNCRWWRI